MLKRKSEPRVSLYSFYEKRIFPRLLDTAMRRLNEHRAETLSAARGDVLEIGFGTGLNLSYYPDGIRSLTAVDPLDDLPTGVAARVEGRVAEAPFPVERHTLSAEGVLPFEAGRFDTVSTTWTLCSIPDVSAALHEMHRVLAREGRLLFIEHGRSDAASVARWQDRLNPLQRIIGCGCNLNRAIDLLIREAGFEITQLHRFVGDRTPRILGSMYQGIARAA